MSYFERYRAGAGRLANRSARDKVGILRQLAAAAEREPRRDAALDAMRAAVDLAHGETLAAPRNLQLQEVLTELTARQDALKASMG